MCDKQKLIFGSPRKPRVKFSNIIFYLNKIKVAQGISTTAARRRRKPGKKGDDPGGGENKKATLLLLFSGFICGKYPASIYAYYVCVYEFAY